MLTQSPKIWLCEYNAVEYLHIFMLQNPEIFSKHKVSEARKFAEAFCIVLY